MTTTTRIRICILFVLTLFLVAACTTSTPHQDSGSIALINVSFLDPSTNKFKSNQTILISGDRISEIGPASSVSIPIGAKQMELKDKFVAPGFIDLHVHLPKDEQVRDAILDQHLRYGVTTFLNPGARPGAGVELRNSLATNGSTAPKMFTAGRIIEKSPASDGLENWAAQVSTEVEIRNEVKKQAKSGVDFVKLYRHLPKELVIAAVDEAKKYGIPVVGHMFETTWKDAAEAGISMLVHSGWGTPIEEVIDLEDMKNATDTEWYTAYSNATAGKPFADLAEVLVKHRIVIVPTLSITQAAGLGADNSLLDEYEVELAPDSALDGWWDKGWEKRHPQYSPDSEEEAKMQATVYFPGALRIVKGYFERGVILGVGTDIGNSWITPGASFHYEMELYQRAGIPPLAILKMATANGATALGIENEVGTIEKGKIADLVILDDDPTNDIRNTRSIYMVLKSGNRVDLQLKK